MTSHNPYPGPRPFESTDEDRRTFFGRARETVVLTGLATARRASLLFSASGAGKSSLINAGLIPALTRTREVGRGERRRSKQRMRIAGTARVGGKASAEARNPFVYLALESLGVDARSADLAHQTLSGGLSPLLETGDAPPDTPSLLVFDQFEELFTQNVDRWRARFEFFEQLGAALDNHPDLHVLFSMREEFIAELTAYDGLLPERLQSRYRLERLDRRAALEAVTRPAAEAGCPFESDDVAEELVDNLLGRRLVDSALDAKALTEGPEEAQLGQFVEPVHLQIVCRQLWQGLEEGSAVIGSADLVKYADVDEALREFFREGLESVLQETDVPEHSLRAWFDETDLVTPTGARGLLLRGAETTGGLPNAAVDLLEDAYLIRRVQRSSDTWVELAHDRLVDPILAANVAWRRRHLKPVTVAAEAWSEADEDPRRLWSGAELKNVAAHARSHQGEYSDLERRFIDRSVARRRKRIGWATGAAITLVLLTGFFGYLWNQAERARREAEEKQYLSAIFLAREQLKDEKQIAAQTTLGNTPKSQRNWEWGYLMTKSSYKEIATNTDELVDVAFSSAADRPLVATSSARGTVTLWDSHSETAAHSLDACPADACPESCFVDVEFSNDGRRLVTVCSEGPTRVWDTASGDRLGETPERFENPSISTDGRRVLAILDEHVEVWDWEPEPDNRLLLPESGSIAAATIRPDGNWVATGSKNGEVALWEAATGLIRTDRVGQAGVIKKIAFSPNGARLVAASGPEARVWRVSSSESPGLEPEGPPLAHDTEVLHIAFSNDGRYLITVEVGNKTRVWAPNESGETAWAEVNRLEGPEARDAAFSPNPESRQVLVGAKGAAVLWGWTSRDERRSFKAPPDVVVQTAFSPDGGQILTRFPGEKVARLWHSNPAWLDTEWEPENPRHSVLAADLVPTATRAVTVREFAAGSLPWGVEIKEIEGKTPPAELPGHDGRVNVAAFSDDGQKLVTSSRDATTVWAVSGTGSWRPSPPLDTSGVVWAAFSPDGKRIVTAAGDFAEVWDVQTGDKLKTLSGHEKGVLHAAFDPRGRRLITTSKDGTARVWNAETGDVLQTLAGHGGRVRFAAFSPDGRRAVTAGEDSTARLWDTETGDLLKTLEGHDETVIWADFSPDETRIATASDDGTVRIWNDAGVMLLSIPKLEKLQAVRFGPEGRELLVVSKNRVRVLRTAPNVRGQEAARLSKKRSKIAGPRANPGPG